MNGENAVLESVDYSDGWRHEYYNDGGDGLGHGYGCCDGEGYGCGDGYGGDAGIDDGNYFGWPNGDGGRG